MYACSPAGQTYSIHFLHTCTICYYKHHYRSLHPLLHNTYCCVIILFEVYTLFLMRIILQFPSLPPLFLSPLPPLSLCLSLFPLPSFFPPSLSLYLFSLSPGQEDLAVLAPEWKESLPKNATALRGRRGAMHVRQAKTEEIKGHMFVKRFFRRAIYCSLCHEFLW